MPYKPKAAALTDYTDSFKKRSLKRQNIILACGRLSVLMRKFSMLDFVRD